MKTIFFLLISSSFCFGQSETPEISSIQNELNSIHEQKNKLLEQLEVLKLKWIQDEINKIGAPKNDSNEEIINHSAYQFSYNEEHEQANWVMHMILPDIETGNHSRSNDFRIDDKVKTGSSQESDYFLKTLRKDSTYEYDGFGYDRGHLAPSADFRWSKKALSESYYYSNMSPQMGDFNRLKWAELENWLREYVTTNETSLFVVTAPKLSKDLKKIKRSTNGVSIPDYFVKVALDVKNKKGIGFILPHQKISSPIENYAVSIDSVEQFLGYNLFSNLKENIQQEVESNSEYTPWLPESEKGDVKAISISRLPKNAINTLSARTKMSDGKKHTVCGKVVSSKKHKKGHVFINLDKKFPNQIFSVSIFESSIKNFDYEPEVYLINKEVCFTAKIGNYKGTTSMMIDNGKQVKLLNEY